MQKVVEYLHQNAPLIGHLGTTIFIVVGIALVIASRHFISRSDIARAGKFAGWTAIVIAVGGALVDVGIAKLASAFVS